MSQFLCLNGSIRIDDAKVKSLINSANVGTQKFQHHIITAHFALSSICTLFTRNHSRPFYHSFDDVVWKLSLCVSTIWSWRIRATNSNGNVLRTYTHTDIWFSIVPLMVYSVVVYQSVFVFGSWSLNNNKSIASECDVTENDLIWRYCFMGCKVFKWRLLFSNLVESSIQMKIYTLHSVTLWTKYTLYLYSI